MVLLLVRELLRHLSPPLREAEFVDMSLALEDLALREASEELGVLELAEDDDE